MRGVYIIIFAECKMHKDALRRLCTRGCITDALIEAQHPEQFCEWYRVYVRK
jgi:hypothetical protein